MKYIDAEKLREEIEFAKSVYSNPQRVVHGIADAFRQDGRVAMCDDILKKLDSLQQEQPEVDLKKYICDKLRELGADLINHKLYSFNRGLNVGKTNAYNDILCWFKARKED